MSGPDSHVPSGEEPSPTVQSSHVPQVGQPHHPLSPDPMTRRSFPFLVTPDQPPQVRHGGLRQVPTHETPPATPRPGKHPVYRGIRCRSGKWVSEIREPRKTTRIWLGTYPTPEMAAAAYDVASLALKGSDAVLNFPHSISSVPVPASSSPTDIRAAAAAAAAAWIPGAGPGASAQPGPGEEASSHTPPAAGGEFVDEEALYAMPNLLANMAEGMLLSPPRLNSPDSDDSPDDSDGESLWSYR